MYITMNDMHKSYWKSSEAGGFITGIESLDRSFAGSEGGLILVGGRPAMGKASFYLSVICNTIRRDEDSVILIISPQHTPRNLYFRMLSIISGIDVDGIKAKDYDDEDGILLEAAEFLKDRHVLIIGSALTQKEIQHEIYEVKREYGRVDLVVIDSLADVLPKEFDENAGIEDVDYDNPYICTSEMVSLKDSYFEDICKGLKKISTDLNCNILCTANTSRLSEIRYHHFPRLEDLRNYGNVLPYADIVILIYREEYYNEDSLGKGKITVSVEKNNEGQLGCTFLRYDRYTTGIYDIERDETTRNSELISSAFKGLSDDDIPF